MANTAIFVRSPRIVQVTGVANDVMRCDLYLWNSPASIPTNPNRVLSKNVPSSIVTTVDFDISEYCRQYINSVSYTEITAVTNLPVTEYCFCTAKTYKNGVLQATYTYIAFDGYGFYEDGRNPSYSDVFLDEGSYLIKEDSNGGGITINDDGTATWTVDYRALSDTGAITTLNVSGVDYVPYIINSFKGTGGNLVKVYKNAVLQKTFRFIEECEPKYTPLSLDFKNKYGAWQRLMLFKASFEMMDVSSTDYNMMSPTSNYNPLLGRKQIFNVNGSEKIRTNTGWVAEDYKEVIKQVMLSEILLLDDKPVKITTKNAELHKAINKRMINYELSFEYAYNIINTIQ